MIAEGLGLVLASTDRRRRICKRATTVLIGPLADEVAEVRFWACYALGVLGVASAFDALREVAVHDEAMYIRGAPWWLVKDEAADAIATILGEPPPPRDRIDATTGEPTAGANEG